MIGVEAEHHTFAMKPFVRIKVKIRKKECKNWIYGATSLVTLCLLKRMRFSAADQLPALDFPKRWRAYTELSCLLGGKKEVLISHTFTPCWTCYGGKA